MTPDPIALRNYIEEQRQKGVDDTTIYQSLLSSGWPPAYIAPSFNPTSQTALANSYPPLQNNSSDVSNDQSMASGFLSGRLGRKGFFLSFVTVIGYFVLVAALAFIGRGSRLTNILVLLGGMLGVLAVLPISISIHVRRWHDIGQSGWMVLLQLVPVVNLIIAIALFFIPGSPGQNEYGLPPSTTFSFKDLIGVK